MAKEKPFIERHPLIVATVTAVIGGFFGGIFPLASNLYQIHSSVAKQNAKLVRELAEERVRVTQKDERISDLRSSVARLEGKLDNKDSQLAVKDLQVDFYRSRLYDQGGTIVTNGQIAIAYSQKTNVGQQVDAGAPRLSGPVFERLGLTADIPHREKMEIGWHRKLYVGELPGLYLRAPDVLLTSYLGIYDNPTNFPLCVSLAKKAYAKVGPILDPFVMQGAEVDVRFAIAASAVYQYLAEDELNKGNYDRAAFLIGTAAGILGPKPPAHLLAMESAIAMRRNATAGFMTRHIRDAIDFAKDDNYTQQIFQNLANLGYLQYYLPNKDNTDVGDPIDWNKGFSKSGAIRLLPTYKKDGDIWSERWKGLGQYEPYNVSKEFRQSLKALNKGVESNAVYLP